LLIKRLQGIQGLGGMTAGMQKHKDLLGKKARVDQRLLQCRETQLQSQHHGRGRGTESWEKSDARSRKGKSRTEPKRSYEYAGRQWTRPAVEEGEGVGRMNIPEERPDPGDWLFLASGKSFGACSEKKRAPDGTKHGGS